MPRLSDDARGRARRWLVPIGLFALAALVRLAAASQVGFPATEGSAYYAGVASNIVSGQGLVSDAVWSYATPPLTVPKPAFELWMPMASLVSVVPMMLLGDDLRGAQGGAALLGALVAPLAWAVAGEAGAVAGLDRRRREAAALAAGLLAAVLGPFVVAAAAPDSTTPFLVFGTLAALLMPRALGMWRAGAGGKTRRTRDLLGGGLSLGVALGLAYLSRQEAVWLAVTFVLLLAVTGRRMAQGTRLRWALARLWPVVLAGLLTVLPWLARNTMTFGSPFPGQALENAFLTRNEEIFAWLERPSATAYLGQGLSTILANPLAAAWHDLLDVILLPAFPVGLAGLLALVGLRRSPALRSPTALVGLLVSGGLTFVASAVIFPVATRWGTFLHASGPLLVGLVVATALGADALLARISTWRRWARPNVILGPAAMLAIVTPLALLQAGFMSRQAATVGARLEEVSVALRLQARTADGSPAASTTDGHDPQPAQGLPRVLISDHPMWLSLALDRPVIALPDEPPAAVADLAATFDAPWLVVIDERGRYPRVLETPEGRACLAADPLVVSGGEAPAKLFILRRECQPS